MFCTPHSYDGASGGFFDVFWHMASMVQVLWGVGANLGDGHGIQGQAYVALLPGNEMSAGFHHRNWIFGR